MRKKFIRSILAISISLSAVTETNAQAPVNIEPKGFSLGMNVGLCDYWGNVGTQSIVDHYFNKTYWNNTHYMGGMFIRYTLHPALAVRLGANYGTLYATDDWNYAKAIKATNEQDDAFQRYVRNQDIKANVWEGQLLFEFNPLRLNVGGKAAHHAGQPELLFGVGYFHFKPFTTFTSKETGLSEWVNLYDLQIDGNGFPGMTPRWQLWQLNVPLGIGWHWDLGDHVNLGVEYLWRYCFVNYIDGVDGKYIAPSLYNKYLTPDHAYVATEVQDKSWIKGYVPPHKPGDIRGGTNNDSYSTISFTLYYRINVHTTPWWAGGKDQY